MEPAAISALLRLLFAVALLGGATWLVIASIERAHRAPPRNRRVVRVAPPAPAFPRNARRIGVDQSGVRECMPQSVRRASRGGQGL